MDTSLLDEGVLILGPDLVSVCKMPWFSLIGNNTFESLGASLLDLPEPTQTGCEEICEKGIRDQLTIGEAVAIRAGGTNTGNRTVTDKAVGVVLLGGSLGNSNIAVSTCAIEDVNT